MRKKRSSFWTLYGAERVPEIFLEREREDEDDENEAVEEK